MATSKKPSSKKPVTRKKNGKQGVYWKFSVLVLLLVLLSPFYYGYVLKVFTSGWQWIKDRG
ncbi:MAG: glycoside hydrolase family 25 protein, partial [Mucilaginibacter sp.]